MATKDDFTADEWTNLLKAPGWASIAVVAASPSGPLGVVKELFAAGKLLAEAKTAAPNPLVSALVSDLTTGDGRQKAQPTELSGKSPDEIRALAVENLRRVASMLDSKGGPDGEALKRWIATLAGRVAEASKEGGFLGIGGTRVSESETATLGEISKALGV